MSFLKKLFGIKKTTGIKPNTLKPNNDSGYFDLKNSTKIILPKLKFGQPEPKEEEENRLAYWETYEKGYSYYQRGWYEKSIETFLTISNNKLSHKALKTHLLRAYRKKITNLAEKKQFKKTLNLYLELFDNCNNFTNTDIKKYNKIVKNEVNVKDNFQIKELIEVNEKNDVIVLSDIFEFTDTIEKPRGWKNDLTYNSLIDLQKSFGNYLLKELPYVIFANENFKIINNFSIDNQLLTIDFKIISDVFKEKIVLLSRDLKIHLIDNNFKTIEKLNVNKIVDDLYSFRYTNINKQENLILFCYSDTLYFCNERLSIQKKLKVPKKDGYFKKVNSDKNFDNNTQENNITRKYLDLLEIVSSQPNKEAIKKAFRKLAKKYHPDIHPEKKLANDKMRELITAYEYLNKEDFTNVFETNEEKEFWYNSIHKFDINVEGNKFEFEILSGMNPDDMIYCADFSNDETFIYLGTKSGKIYKSNLEGQVEKVYKIPECESSIYNSSNCVYSIKEVNDKLHIKTSWFLYILENDKTIKYFDIEKTEVKYFEQGFVLINGKRKIEVYDFFGKEQGVIELENDFKNLIYNENYFLIETNRKFIRIKKQLSPKQPNLQIARIG